MATGKRDFYDDPQRFLDEMADGLKRVERWAHYPERKHRDNGLQHAFQTAMLAKIMLAIERELGNADDLDGERIVSAGFSHDIGEWLLGDVRYQVKNDPRVKEPLRAIETELYEQEILAPLPEPVQKALAHASGLQDDRTSRSGRFFNAVEQIGYVIYAIREYREGNHRIGLAVFTRQHESLVRYMEEFASVRTIYGKYLPEIEAALAAAADTSG
ncbi:HD domain-containing protein [Candidatus Uhrbacteria bacterium]|nr:HD domain-containing protein [Candidatus Uhrbacteria bacterium]